MAYKPKAPPVMAAPNVIPMADIMLVLLIIFMVVTPMLQKGVSVDMAKVNNARDLQDADKDDAIILAVTRDGKMYLGSTQVSAGRHHHAGEGPDRQPPRQDRIRSLRFAREIRRCGQGRGRGPLRRRGSSRLAHGKDQSQGRSGSSGTSAGQLGSGARFSC